MKDSLLHERDSEVSLTKSDVALEEVEAAVEHDQQNGGEDTSSKGGGGYCGEPMKYFISISLGILAGAILNLMHASDGVVTLSTVPGQLFLRALQCAVIPMMFFNITASVYDIFGSGEAGAVGKRAIYYYSISTLLAVAEGILFANVFSFLFNSDEGDSDDDDGVEVNMVCPESYGTMTVESDGSIMCIHKDAVAAFNLSSDYQNFYLQDKDDKLVNGVVLKNTIVQQLLTTAFSVVPDNMTEAFAVPNIISVIIISFCLGAALVKAKENVTSKDRNVSKIGSEKVLTFMKEMANVSNIIIAYVVQYTPYCIGFLIANSLASSGNIADLIESVGIYMCAAICGIMFHCIVVLPAMFYYVIGENPYIWARAIKRPLIVAFSTESSAATLPMSIETALDSGLIDPNIVNTILPMGSTINMDGTAIGFPCAVSFLAHSAKLENKLDIVTWVNVALGASLGSAGSAPVPNASVIMLITVWETAFAGYAVPDAIAYVQAVAFIVSRFQTACNVYSDLFIVRIIQASLNQEKKNL
jgi:Na+/H+-dicarboxylate symporter